MKALKPALSILLLALVFMLAAPGHATTAKPAAAKRSYIELFNKSDPAALEIAKKVLAADLQEYVKLHSMAPEMYAEMMSLGPKTPKNIVAVYISHPAVCGSSGCQVILLEPTGKDNAYRILFETTAMRSFYNLRPGQDYYDLLFIVGPRASDGFGVWYFNSSKHQYTYAGVSRFATQ